MSQTVFVYVGTTNLARGATALLGIIVAVATFAAECPETPGRERRRGSPPAAAAARARVFNQRCIVDFGPRSGSGQWSATRDTLCAHAASAQRARLLRLHRWRRPAVRVA